MEEFEKKSATHIVSATKVTRNPKLLAYSKFLLMARENVRRNYSCPHGL